MARSVTKPILLDETGQKIASAIEAHTQELSTSMKVDVMVGASASLAGKSGYAPAPSAGKQNAFLKGDGTWASADLVQTYSESSNTYPILAMATADATQTVTNKAALFGSNIKIQPSTGTIIANKFDGVVTNAEMATKDAQGRVIADTYALKSDVFKPETLGGEELVWTLTSDYSSGATITLPNEFKYPHSMNALRVSLDGAVMSLGLNYEEVISDVASAYSTQIKPLCNLTAGMVLHIWVVPLSYSLAQFEDKVYGLDGNILKAQNAAARAEAAAATAESWSKKTQDMTSLQAYLLRSGGTMTGAILFDYSNTTPVVGEIVNLPIQYKCISTTGNARTFSPLCMIPTAETSSTGNGIGLCGGGATLVGSGESVSNYVKNTLIDGANKTTFILSDTAIKFVTNCQTIASKKESTLDASGNLTIVGTITGSKVYNAVFNDYAEFFEKGEETEVGDIVALDLTSDEERYVKATSPYHIVGVHSDTYGHILGGSESIEESEKTHIPVGLVGRVMTKITGSIKKGDLVVLSDIPGVGRAYDPSIDDNLKVIGFAIETNDSEEIKLVKIKLRG